MTTDVKIPPMGESISSGIIASWHVKDGDVVNAGQVLYELETDKITSEGQAEVGGRISLKAAAGEEVAIGQVIATIDTSASAAAPAASKAAAPAVAPAASSSSAGLSPAVQRLAAETGINPANIPGTGKDGRVTKGDMISAAATPAAPVAKAAAAQPSVTASAPVVRSGERTTRKKMTPMRRKIAERLVSAQHEAAMLTTFNEIDMSHVMNVRKKYQDDFVKKHGIKLGFMSFFVRAVVKALQEVPEINSQISGDEIIQNHFFDISIAVGGPKGLVVPVVRDCDQLTFAGVEKSIVDYATRARDGKITVEDMQGGVFTITNGGIYGSMLSTPIINPPQSAILGMHNIVERAMVINGEIKVRPMMYVALSYDHRVVDGKEAVTFLVKIKEAIENPERMLYGI